MTDSESPFSLTISLNVLEHLGINLYSNVPAVLAEIVANSWDADASTVKVDWSRETDQIVIQDDGTGMTESEVNERFLTVGYRRRDDQPGHTGLGRAPLGRKGIGKLSLFAIAGIVEIETAKQGQLSALRMSLEDIRAQILKEVGGDTTYRPDKISTDSIDFEQGTRITLNDLKKRHTISTTKALKRRIARRFSIIGAARGFRVFINGEEVGPADRDYYDKIQYLWTYGDQSDVVSLCNKAQHFDRSPVLHGSPIPISGWLGTVSEVKHLKDEEGENLNKIAIDVRGKTAQEDILSDFAERGVYASYLIGDLRVDQLDVYDGLGTAPDADAATTSRQRLVEDDDRYIMLKQFLGDELKHIQGEWSRLRADQGSEKAMEIPAVRDWINGLNPGVRAKARRWLGRINRIRVDDWEEQKQLIKHAVLAFEFYRFHESLDSLESISDDTYEAALDILHELDALELSLYGQIVQERIRIIRALTRKVDENVRERVIQQYLFDHLWLLDPSWERVESTAVMEIRVGTLFREVDEQLTEEEKLGRLDIRYRKTAGKHVIIEMKRPARTVSLHELTSQIHKYHSGMLRIMEQQPNENGQLDFVILLGKPLREHADVRGFETIEGALKTYNARIVYYDDLLGSAERSYRDYLDKRSDLDRLDEVIRAVDDFDPAISDA